MLEEGVNEFGISAGVIAKTISNNEHIIIRYQSDQKNIPIPAARILERDVLLQSEDSVYNEIIKFLRLDE